MTTANRVRLTMAIGSLLGTCVLGGCGDSGSGNTLADASSDSTVVSDTRAPTTTDTSNVPETDARGETPAPDAPRVEDAPGGPDGSSPDRSSDPAGIVSSDGGCPTGQLGVYTAPGCGAAARLECAYKTLDACAALQYYCGCDGQTSHMTTGCGGSEKPYLYRGPCKIDGGVDAEPACRMELETFSCQPGWTSMLCCPPTLDETLASVPACDPENRDESTRAGKCDGLAVLHRDSSTGGTITCAYAISGTLAGAEVRAGSSRVIPFCMTSRTARAGEALPSSCDPTSLPHLRSCAP